MNAPCAHVKLHVVQYVMFGPLVCREAIYATQCVNEPCAHVDLHVVRKYAMFSPLAEVKVFIQGVVSAT